MLDSLVLRSELVLQIHHSRYLGFLVEIHTLLCHLLVAGGTLGGQQVMRIVERTNRMLTPKSGL